MSEQRQRAGPAGTPAAPQDPWEDVSIHIGPAPRGRGQHLKGQGTFVSFLVALLGGSQNAALEAMGWTEAQLVESARRLWWPLNESSLPVALLSPCAALLS